MNEDYSELDRLSQLFHTLSDSGRLRILIFIMQNGKKCVNDVSSLTGIPQPASSRALNALKKTGVLCTERVENRVFYSIDQKCPFYENLRKIICQFRVCSSESFFSPAKIENDFLL